MRKLLKATTGFINREAAGVIEEIPWAMVCIAFVLILTPGSNGAGGILMTLHENWTLSR
jgi:hypothetical protein